MLAVSPDSGALIRQSGGLRKFRWAIEGRGKSGGVHFIYYWARDRDPILMLLVYAENERDDLDPAQIATLRSIVEAEY